MDDSDCFNCGGTGKRHKSVTCRLCKGKGSHPCPSCSLGDMLNSTFQKITNAIYDSIMVKADYCSTCGDTESIECTRCYGCEEEVITVACEDCRGTGKST